MTCHCGQCPEAPHGGPSATTLGAFLEFLRANSEVVHLAFVPSYEGVDFPCQESAAGAPMVYIDIQSNQPESTITMDQHGLKITLPKSHPDHPVKIPWVAVVLLANDFGFSWKNDPLLQALQQITEAAMSAPQSKFVH